MTRRRALPAAAVVAAVALLAGGLLIARVRGGAGPALPVGPSVPQLDDVTWVGSQPLGTDRLRGSVVLYDVFSFACERCVRTVPAIRALADRYAGDGLVVIGVHTARFAFEADQAAATAAFARLGVTYPVALDATGSWARRARLDDRPAVVVADRDGRRRWTSSGDGDETTLEDAVRSLLGPLASPRRAGVPETAASRPTLVAPFGGPVALDGGWTGAGDHDDGRAGSVATIRTGGAGTAVVVLGAVSATIVDVTVDGRPVPLLLRTPDVAVDGAGRTTITVAEPDRRRLFLQPSDTAHTVRLRPVGGDVSLYAVDLAPPGNGGG